MRANQPLPGDLVVRTRQDRPGPSPTDVFVVTRWPDADDVLAGPYQSASYAIRQARLLPHDRSGRLWRDRARPGEPERLEDITHPRER